MTDDQTLIKLIRYIRDELDLHDLREKASDSECKMLRNQLLRNLRIHARPRVATTVLTRLLAERENPLFSFEVVVTKKGSVRDVLKELDASSREVLRHVLDLIRHAGEEIHQILSPSLCRPVDGEFMSLLHISGLDQIRGMVASLVMQYDLIFAKDEDEDEMDEGEDQEDEIREEKRSSDKSYVRELLRETVAEMLFDTISDDEEDEEEEETEQKKGTCMTSQERREMVRRCRDLRMEMKIAEADYEAAHGTYCSVRSLPHKDITSSNATQVQNQPDM